MSDKPFLDFEGKTIVVSGASSGIGRAVSIELSNNGANLILIGRDQERLAETADGVGPGAQLQPQVPRVRRPFALRACHPLYIRRWRVRVRICAPFHLQPKQIVRDLEGPCAAIHDNAQPRREQHQACQEQRRSRHQ